MLGNIVDRRTNKYNTKCDAAYEPSWHDNCVDGATQFHREAFAGQPGYQLTYDELLNTTVELAIIKSFFSWTIPVTIFLYDEGTLNV